ncbi:BnaAnng17490D [Brassica napus]|uniref:BnaAnng17490D protein n=1 Tax=Brassica napus TaxID=3708 RepID=A0A078J4Z4_BRANA|nr:BnaAnng17490D [Brassica napus]
MFSNFLESLYDGIGDDEADDDDDENNPKTPTERHVPERNADRLPPMSPEEEAQARGVKDDLSELSHTLTRKFRGVANFLAPLPERSSSDLSNPRLSQSRFSDPELNQPPSSSDRPESRVGDDTNETRETEIRAKSWGSGTMEDKRLEDLRDDPEEEEEEEETDEEEEEEEEEEMDAVALTDEVLAFARNIAMHPETWLDFPLDPDEDLDDLEMSDAQRGHALAIERLAPRLAALRIELCPCHMTVGYFWKVYFVLLLSRLNKHDAELLSSPQVMEARALWMKELQSQNSSTKTGYGDILKEEEVTPSTSSYYNHAPPEFLSPRIYAFEPPSIMYRDFETTDRGSGSENAEFIDKAVIEEKPIQKSATISATPNEDEDDDDDWPEEEDDAHDWAPMFTGNEDDVSFSDLEGDDDISSLALKSKTTSQKGT